MKKVFLLSIGLAALALTGCGGGSKKIATVNGETISEEEFINWLQFKPKVNVVLANGQVAEASVSETLGYQALQDLIRNKLIMQYAKDKNVMPTEADIDKEIAFRRKQNPQFLANLTGAGLSVAQVKDQMKIELARERVLTSGIEVTNLEVDSYIKRNPKEFKTPAMCDMLWVFVRSKDKKAKVDTALHSMQAFGTVASRYSDFEGGANNGRFPQNEIEGMNPLIREKVVNKVPENATSEWIQLQDGWAKFYVEKKTPSKEITIDETVKENVRRRIAMQQGVSAIDLDSRLLERMKKSEIEVSKAGLKERWKVAMDRLNSLNLDK